MKEDKILKKHLLILTIFIINFKKEHKIVVI